MSTLIIAVVSGILGASGLLILADHVWINIAVNCQYAPNLIIFALTSGFMIVEFVHCNAVMTLAVRCKICGRSRAI